MPRKRGRTRDGQPIPSFKEWYANTKAYGGTREEYQRLYGPDGIDRAPEPSSIEYPTPGEALNRGKLRTVDGPGSSSYNTKKDQP